MSRAKNDKEFLRTVKMTRTIYTLSDEGEFDMHEDNQYYKERTLSEILGVDHTRTRRFSSKFDDKKRKREFKDSKTKGRCNNKNYKLSESRFRKNGGRSNG